MSPTYQEYITRIDEMTKVSSVEAFIRNANRRGETDLVEYARDKLIRLELNHNEPMSALVRDFYDTLIRYEKEKGRRANRTREKLSRDGFHATLVHLVHKSKNTDGFDFLKGRKSLKLSFEALVLRHKESFESEVIQSAQNKLDDAGYGLDTQ